MKLAHLMSHLPRVLLTIACLVALAFGLFRVGEAAKNVVVTERSETNYLVASWRGAKNDDAIVAQLQGSRRVRYARGNDPFVQSVMRSVKMSPTEARERGLVVFSGANCMIDQLAREADPLGAALGLAKAESGRRQSSNIPLALMAGGFLGLWLRLARPALIGAMALGVGLSLYQFATACPTCPATTLLNVPVALWGAALYAGLALLLASPRSVAMTLSWVGPIVAGIAAWQVAASTLAGTDCLPCSFVAALNGALAVSALLGGTRVPRVAPPARMGRTVVALAGCALAALAVARVAGTETLGMDGSRPTPPASLVGRSITELGIQPSGKPEAILLASKACAPCLKALAYFKARPSVPLRNAFVDGVPPGSRGEVLANTDLIRTTPTFLFTDAKGVVQVDRPGWTDAAGGEMETRIRSLTGSSDAEGAKVEDEQQ